MTSIADRDRARQSKSGSNTVYGDDSNVPAYEIADVAPLRDIEYEEEWATGHQLLAWEW